ncbi:MAG: hypothetical protein ACRD0F_02390 [Acidimicrobiales bacterium]
MSDNGADAHRSPPDDWARSVADAVEAGAHALSELQRRLAGDLRGATAVGDAAFQAVVDRARQQLGDLAGKAPGGAKGRPPAVVVEGLEPKVAERFAVAAGARGMTSAAYLTALVDLHESMRRLADAGGNEDVAGGLERLGLATVTT